MQAKRTRAPRNRTIELSEQERVAYEELLIMPAEAMGVDQLLNRTILGDMFKVVEYLPDSFVDLLIVDPPYNLNKDFDGNGFRRTGVDEYTDFTERWLTPLLRLLKPTATVYICSDWRSSTSIHSVAAKYLQVNNRITWEREKGRGALHNWKNCTEDIWFCSVGRDFKFNVDAVKMKRKVIAPYRVDGKPKDWTESEDGNFRITFPSNIWTDITVPYWSMPENTDHPTQKPEKLLAKLILASSDANDVVFDPFLGVGTTAVTAKKLGRRYLGIELSREYALLAQKRLAMADADRSIQGYVDGVFWERNSLNWQSQKNETKETPQTFDLFQVGAH